MSIRTPAIALGFALSYVTGIVCADPPKINDIRPVGVQRATTMELTISGSGLAGNPSLLAPFPFQGNVKPNSDGGNYRIDLTIPASVAVGVYPVRVKTDDGLSNPFLLAIGQVPQIAEVEENSTFEQAQAVPSPVVIEGQCAGTDVDYFRFPGKKGQRIIVDAQCARVGSGVDPQVRLTTIGRKFIEAADDTPGLLTDARFSVVLPEDGDYVIEFSDSKYQGTGRASYRLMIGAVPVAAEVYPIGGRRGETIGVELRGGTLPDVKVAATTIVTPPPTDLFRPQLFAGDPFEIEIPTPLEVSDYPEIRESSDPTTAPVRGVAPVVFNGRIESPNDEDRFNLSVVPGQNIRIRVIASELGSALDGTMQVLGPNGAVLATAEDTVIPAVVPKGQKKVPGGVSPDPSLVFAVPAGVTEITLAIRDLIGRGGIGFPYRILVEPVDPQRFELGVNEGQINIPKGGTAAVGVNVLRQGYAGPIVVSIANPPAGLTMSPLTIPAGQAAGIFTLTTSKETSFGPLDLRLIGTGQGPNNVPIIDLASKTVVFAQQGTMPVNSFVQYGLPASTSLALPASVEAPNTPIEIVHGFGGMVPLKVIRGDKADGALTIAMLPGPPSVTVSGTIPEKVAEGPATINTPAEAPLGQSVLVLTAKGKLDGKDMTLTIPAVTINVVPPAVIELSAPAIEIKAGTPFEFKGKVIRKAALKEPIKVQINALPAGLKAEPVTVAPDASEFTIKIESDAAAAAAMANAQVVISFQVNKKDYATPPATLAVKVVK